ncbi:MAG: hypothetical protein LiPW41_548 [Parcubacteria group bacterium LiPW_41]|nr:MAG: hypothetical protein LiPW41_548 [Parcubacteria group bacterium LiPW_41]
MKFKILKADKRHKEEIDKLIQEVRIGSGVSGSLKNFWFVRVNNQIVACAGIDCIDPQTAIFTHCAVRKEFRHNGIGSALINKRMEFARILEMKTIALITMYYHFNFYKRRGFRTCPRKELPDNLKNYWMFTARQYMKCAVMVNEKF